MEAAETTPTDPGRSVASNAATLYRQIRGHIAQLAGEVDAVKRTRGFTAALDAMSQFWSYSPFNQFLIHMQRQDATRVAGRRAWERLGRQVKPGTCPILVLAPAPRFRPPFVAVPVFDVSQTRGKALPSLDLLVRGKASAARRLEQVAPVLGVEVRPLDGPSGLVGCSTGGVIFIRRGLPGRERAATIAHELAHELLHWMRSRGTATHAQIETEADAVSYVVMRALGLPSKAPTYIAWQGGSGALVLGSMKRVQRAARRILRAYDGVSRGARRPCQTRV